ncbi:hypothetical protein [Streptomyces iakyrus]
MRLDPGDPEREGKVERVFALIRQDIRDEEDLVLPRVQEALDDARLRRLGAAWETVRRAAPTHPHPVVPRRPPGNALPGVPLSLYDRIRDGLGPARPSAVVRRGRTGLTELAGLLASAAVAAIVRKRR